MKTEQGFTLIETLAAAGICALAIFALAGSMAAFARYGAHAAGPVRSAATALAEQTLRVAEDAWKYGNPGDAPSGSWQTALPMEVPGSGPTTAPATVTTTLGSDQAGGTILTVSVAYTPDPNHQDSGSVTVSGPLDVKAPPPGSQVVRPGVVAAPAGAL